MQIMYDIYANVDDPDGFYGIQSNNARRALVLQVDHEGQFGRALGLDSAALEAGGFRKAGLATIRNLHSLGFDQMANTMLQSLRKRHHSLEVPEALLFALAWRSGDWDLPVAQNVSTSGLVYEALRSIHQGTDALATSSTVRISIQKEMMQLRDYGVERIGDIQETVDSLLCLREVEAWLSDDTQRSLTIQGELSPAGNTLSSFPTTMR